MTISPGDEDRSENGDNHTVIAQGAGAAERLVPGTVLHHTYEIERFIGSGGMGDIYQARNIVDGSPVAIKVIRQHLIDQARMSELFRREGGALREVRHDAVVGYGALFRDEQNRMFLVMDFVDGPSLAERLKDEALTVEQVLRLKNRLAHGLAEAHKKGVFHRDVSPDNILLPGGSLERATIIDFGIAKRADSTAGTVIGSDVAGKLAFLAPEQVGLYHGEVDARSDIYSLGLVLAAAARGRPLDMGRNWVEVVEKRKRLPDLDGVPVRLRPVIARMLAPNPKDRPQSMEEVIELGAADGRGQMRGGRWVAAAVLTMLLLAGAGVWLADQQGGPLVDRISAWLAPAELPSADDATGSGPAREAIESAIVSAQAGVNCADVGFAVDDAGRVELSGFIANHDDLTKLVAKVEDVAGVAAVSPDRVDVQPWPFCDTLRIIAPFHERNVTDNLGLEVDIPEGEILHDGDVLSIPYQTPIFEGYLYIDYIQHDGLTVHVRQTAAGLPPVAASQQLVEKTPYTIGPPFGREMIVITSSEAPLFETLRPESEDASEYLPALERQVSALDADQKIATSYVFVETQPAPQ